MAAATVIESYVNEYFRIIEAEPNIIFCDSGKKFLEDKKFDEQLSSKSVLLKVGEKNVKFAVWIKTFFYKIHLKHFKHSIETGQKSKRKKCKKV